MTEANYRRILGWGFPWNVLNRDLRLIFASNLLGSFGDGLYAYLLPNYMTNTLHASPEEIGALYAVVGLISALTLFLAGTFADKYDRKKIMIIGWIAWAPVPLIFSLAGNWLQMLPGMLLWGVWLGGPTTTAYVMTTADKSKLTVTFTAISSAWSLGYIFSPAIGGYIAGMIGMQTVLYAAFLLYSSAGLILTFINSQKATGHKEQSSEEQYSLLKLLKSRKLQKFSLLFATILFVLLMFRPFIPKFLGDIYHHTDFEIGILGSICFFSSAVFSIILGKLGDRWKKSYALSISIALGSLSLILLLLFSDFKILIFTFFLTGGSYITWSLMSAIIAPHAPEAIRARWVSIPQTISMFSSFIAPYIGGILYGISPYYLLMTAIAATAVLALLVSLTEC